MRIDSYEIRESVRAKYLRLTVYPDGRVVLTKPKRTSSQAIERFLQKHEAWIARTQEKFIARTSRNPFPAIPLPRPRKGSAAYTEARRAARVLVTERLRYFNTTYKFTYGTISIRDQKTRWGSCSHAGNLSFNYRIVFLPPRLAAYIVVHELCHTKEHNHSEKFWAEVARTIPNHKELRKELRTRYSA